MPLFLNTWSLGQPRGIRISFATALSEKIPMKRSTKATWLTSSLSVVTSMSYIIYSVLARISKQGAQNWQFQNLLVSYFSRETIIYTYYIHIHVFDY